MAEPAGSRRSPVLKYRFFFGGAAFLATVLFFGPSPAAGAETAAPAVRILPRQSLVVAVNVPGSDEPSDPVGDIGDLGLIGGETGETFYDPLEPFNRAMFHFNDRLYFWFFKPIARGYRFVVPEPARTGVKRFFSNLGMPVRFFNSLLQLKIHDAGAEISRFVINTTIGLGGVMDPARAMWELDPKEEDFGQTLGFYGVGGGVYLVIPFFGPTSLRDGIGLAVDTALDPVSYVIPTNQLGPVGFGGITVYKWVNETSLQIGKYEGIKKDALDPYVYIRDAYYQHRVDQIAQ
jgi:phospholipid-binding lipoprotein MlaA